MVSWRFATDWARPQSDDLSAPNYCSLQTDGPASLKGCCA